MESLYVSIIGIVSMVILLAAGINVAFALAGVGLAGLCFVLGCKMALGHLAITAYATTSQYHWAVFPLFIIMGNVAGFSGITKDAFESAKAWLGKLPGGVAMATCMASGIFSACSGSTIANAAVFTSIALPEMKRNGYDVKLSVGAIAASGTFAAMIPPSIGMVIYGMITGEPIGRLFIAGIIPGVLTIGIYVIGIYIRIKRNPGLAPSGQRFSFTQKITSLKGTWPILLIFLLIMAGIYRGWFAPSAAGAVGAAATLILVIVRKRFNLSKLINVLFDAVSVGSTLFLVLIGGILFSKFLTVCGFADAFSTFVTELNVAPILIIILLMVIFLILGCFIDPPSMMVITLPIVYPIIKKLGFDGIWFGIILTKVVEIALITPPVGLNAYVVNSAAGDLVKLEDVFKGIFPFLFLELITLTILVTFPGITLWLPAMMD